MSTSRKVQIALGAILLWSSTSVSSFAATNTINHEKFQSDTVKLSVENIPSRQLNLTQDPKLIAQMDIGSMLRQLPGAYGYIDKFEEAWKKSDRKQRILNFCNASPPDNDVERCYSYLKMWLIDKHQKYFDSRMNPTDPGLEGPDFIALMRAEPPAK